MVLNVGLIGLGEVAQLMHIPVLSDLGSCFRIRAVSDISPSLVQFVQERHTIEKGYLSAHDLIADEELDVIFILSPDQYHVEYATRSLEAGKHVFIEKPAALSLQDLEQLIECEKKHPNQRVMVGYMRRFAPTFLKAKELVATYPKGKIEYVRMRDIILEAPFYIGQTRSVFYPADVPKEMIEEARGRKEQQLAAALGPEATEVQKRAYTMLTGLGCHTLSAIKEIVGHPQKVLSVVSAFEGEQLVVVLQYDGFIGIYELFNREAIVQFDAAMELYLGDTKVLIKYETPYIRHTASTLEVIESDDKETKTTLYGPDYRDPFYIELREFHASITENRPVKTSLSDSAEDLRLFQDIVGGIR